jgi:hypothetical protein
MGLCSVIWITRWSGDFLATSHLPLVTALYCRGLERLTAKNSPARKCERDRLNRTLIRATAQFEILRLVRRTPNSISDSCWGIKSRLESFGTLLGANSPICLDLCAAEIS